MRALGEEESMTEMPEGRGISADSGVREPREDPEKDGGKLYSEHPKRSHKDRKGSSD